MPELKNSRRPEAVVIIRNIKGLHARASAKFVKCAENFNAEVTVTRDGQSVGGTSIMGLMMLAAGPGSELRITAEGPQGPEALQALVTLVEAGFDEVGCRGVVGLPLALSVLPRVLDDAELGDADRTGLDHFGVAGQVASDGAC